MKHQVTETLLGSPEHPETWLFRAENGIVTQIAEIESRKPETGPVRILQCSDIHLNITNEEDESNAEVMYTRQCRLWNAEGASIPVLKKILRYAEGFDQTVITGDTMDYLTAGAMEQMEKLIWTPYPDTLICPGGHDYTRQMQTHRKDETSVESRMHLLERFWHHDMHYQSVVLKNKVMLVCLDNGLHRYLNCQTEPLLADIRRARENNLIILIFQHEPICTGRPEDEVFYAQRVYDGETRNYYSGAIGCPEQEEPEASKAVYRLITENADVIKALFTGHYHSFCFTEVNASYTDSHGIRHETKLPQYDCVPAVYDGYAGHVIEITVR